MAKNKRLLLFLSFAALITLVHYFSKTRQKEVLGNSDILAETSASVDLPHANTLSYTSALYEASQLLDIRVLSTNAVNFRWDEPDHSFKIVGQGFNEIEKTEDQVMEVRKYLVSAGLKESKYDLEEGVTGTAYGFTNGHTYCVLRIVTPDEFSEQQGVNIELKCGSKVS